ncbi:hypothetical protein [Nocardiopsis suaedae]|uniref:Uncharacterized protein n=1 Tax=Nocardiopsis suaedae TaxID=3018444 RepID=A0ABT4TE92_9ACTN|nr:hypothetical protein [Nocardiopsis suaedae]MDA2803032.1 hypothetical protein [Nocardiopsis suaedae]
MTTPRPTDRDGPITAASAAVVGTVAACIPGNALGWPLGALSGMMSTDTTQAKTPLFAFWMAVLGLITALVTALPLRAVLKAAAVHAPYTPERPPRRPSWGCRPSPESGWSLARVDDHFGISPDTVRHRLLKLKHGVQIRDRHER